MSSWLENAILRAESVDDWLRPERSNSLALLRDAKWPNRKVEAWKYTSVAMLADASYGTAANAQTHLAPSSVNDIDGLECIDLLFLDGELQSLPTELPEGLSIVAIDQASSATRDWVRETFGKVKPSRHLFGLVNDVLAQAGIIIDVADNTLLPKPIRIVSRFSDNCEDHLRIVTRIGKQAKAVIIEDQGGEEASFNTCFAEYLIEQDAELEHYRLSLQTGKAINIGGAHFQLNDSAHLNSTLVGFGSELSRTDVDIKHYGQFTNAKMNAIYLLDGDEVFDLHTNVEHAVANGTTEENVHGIVAAKAKAIFNGRIHIHRDAQKTLAELNNRNLLLSRDAEINTKPELEIYADDVRCAHGATVAEMDKKSLYYLQSRGISKEQAQIMLSFGFVNELVDQMPNQQLAEWLRPQLRQRFAQMEIS